MIENRASCMDCGGTFYLIDGTPCPCSHTGVVLGADTLATLPIPSMYIENTFSASGVDYDVNSYNHFLGDLYKDIVSFKKLNKNIFIGAPKGSSKNTFVYSILRHLHAYKQPIFPYMDLDELNSVMRAIEDGKEKCNVLESYDISPMALLTTPLLIVRTSPVNSYRTYTNLSKIISRRSHRRNDTLIMSDICWSEFIKNDFNKTAYSLMSSGKGETILVKDFFEFTGAGGAVDNGQ